MVSLNVAQWCVQRTEATCCEKPRGLLSGIPAAVLASSKIPTSRNLQVVSVQPYDSSICFPYNRNKSLSCAFDLHHRCFKFPCIRRFAPAIPKRVMLSQFPQRIHWFSGTVNARRVLTQQWLLRLSTCLRSGVRAPTESGIRIRHVQFRLDYKLHRELIPRGPLAGPGPLREERRARGRGPHDESFRTS